MISTLQTSIGLNSLPDILNCRWTNCTDPGRWLQGLLGWLGPPSSQFSGDYDDTSVGLVFITLWLFNSSPWEMAPIEIDGLPNLKMVILTRWYFYFWAPNPTRLGLSITADRRIIPRIKWSWWYLTVITHWRVYIHIEYNIYILHYIYRILWDVNWRYNQSYNLVL